MEEVRRSGDHELCGHVELRNGSWFALVVFGAVLGRHSTRDEAVEQVLSEGLASLAERWTLQRAGHLIGHLPQLRRRHRSQTTTADDVIDSIRRDTAPNIAALAPALRRAANTCQPAPGIDLILTAVRLHATSTPSSR